jgi:hypothetical protein
MRADEKLQPFARGGASSPLEKRAGDFLADARPTVGLTDGEVAGIARRLSRPRRARPRLGLWPVLAGIAVLLVGGSVMAVVGGWMPRLPFVRDAAPVPSEPTNSRPPIRRERKGSNDHAVTPATPSLEPSEAPAAVVALPSTPRSPVRRGARAEPWSPSPSPPPPMPAAPGPPEDPGESSLSIEARSLADALARWRRDGNAEAALALLGAHDRRFARGAFTVESKVARAEILLALGRRAEALTALDPLTLRGLPRARELETIRGELRSQAGRCADARADLAHVLRARPDDEFGARASRALTKCP